MEAMSASGIAYTRFFDHPQLPPLQEYKPRKKENIRFAHQPDAAGITRSRVRAPLHMRGLPHWIIVHT